MLDIESGERETSNFVNRFIEVSYVLVLDKEGICEN
jgi:hypothetical protein